MRWAPRTWRSASATPARTRVPLKIRDGSGRHRLDRHLVTEPLEASQGAADDGVSVVLLEVGGAQILEDDAVFEDVIDGDQERVSNRNCRPLCASTCREAPVAGGEEAGLARVADRPGGLQQAGAQPTIAATDGCVAALSRRLVVARTHAGPGDEVGYGREARHVDPGLDQDLLGSSKSQTGNLIQAFQRHLERAH